MSTNILDFEALVRSKLYVGKPGLILGSAPNVEVVNSLEFNPIKLGIGGETGRI